MIRGLILKSMSFCGFSYEAEKMAAKGIITSLISLCFITLELYELCFLRMTYSCIFQTVGNHLLLPFIRAL